MFKKARTSKAYHAFITQEPGDEYHMNHKRRGKCVILNHRKFESKTLNERKGTDIDAQALKRCFELFGFTVTVYNDLTVAELTAILNATAKEDHSDADCFACCIMTHGDQANLWARNDVYPVDKLFTPFTADNCVTLATKPKLFFIQACRGEKLDPGVVIKCGTDEVDAVKYYTIPTFADFLISYSTFHGYYSWRNTRDGSWFMQSLAEVMCQYAAHTSFTEVITYLNRKVAFDYTSCVPDDKNFDKQKQVPSTHHMLTRRLVLRPKIEDEKPKTNLSKNSVKITEKLANVKLIDGDNTNNVKPSNSSK